MHATRRGFIGGAFSTGAGLILGCTVNGPGRGTGGEGGATSDTSTGSSAGGNTIGAGGSGEGGAGGAGGVPPETCEDLFAAGQLLETLDFTSDGNLAKHSLQGNGWDARLYTDLAEVDFDNRIVSNDRHFVRTRYPDLLNPTGPWEIDVNGLVSNTTLTISELEALSQPRGPHVMECSGNFQSSGFGLLSAAEWSGALVTDVLDMLDISSSATRVRIAGFDGHSIPSNGGHSSPGASWIFTFEDLQHAIFATEMNGVPLPPHHGEPVRLLMPGWYGCSCIKWVNEITLVDESAQATSQMREFASRTHQNGVPNMAAQYKPATIDQTAMPVRLEKWSVNSEIVYRVVGIMWGGYELADDKLRIRFDNGPLEPVEVCPSHTTNQTWTVWEYLWRPEGTGYWNITCQIDDPNIVTKRLDTEFYLREVYIDEV